MVEINAQIKIGTRIASMKTILKSLITAILTLALIGCTTQTSHGACVGLGDEDIQNPNKIYKLSVWNTILGVLFFETIVVPIVVVATVAKCPVADK